MQDFSRYTSQYHVCSQFNCDLTCFEVLSDTCDDETLECLSLGRNSQNCQDIYDCSAFANKTHVTVDEGLPDYGEDLILNFQNPCNSSALVSGVDFENQDEFLRHLHATPSADLGSWRKEIFNGSDSPDFGQGGNTFARCQDNTVELNNFRPSFTDVCISPCSTLRLQVLTPSSLLTHIIHDHNYSKPHSTLLRELGQSTENSLSSEDEVDQLVPSAQSNQNVYRERVISSCVDHQVPQLCIEE